MSIIKPISLGLLSALVTLTISAVLFIPGTMSQSMEHEGCFGQTCGPIQHLLHNFTLYEYTFAQPTRNQTTIVVTDQKPTALLLSPDTPPPRTGEVVS